MGFVIFSRRTNGVLSLDVLREQKKNLTDKSFQFFWLGLLKREKSFLGEKQSVSASPVQSLEFKFGDLSFEIFFFLSRGGAVRKRKIFFLGFDLFCSV